MAIKINRTAEEQKEFEEAKKKETKKPYASKAQINAIAKYNKNNTKPITIRLNKKTDAKIIEYLDSIDNKSGTIKRLILEEIERTEKKENSD